MGKRKKEEEEEKKEKGSFGDTSLNGFLLVRLSSRIAISQLFARLFVLLLSPTIESSSPCLLKQRWKDMENLMPAKKNPSFL